ncbi:hypothetical protein V6N12_023352 [Hibiscus sabdariffa]|uniref:Uncharacterized protein n=1 Tax=Hibiscus sabdariffa TaxID=183260 RepID=A0ABR2FXX0_9ROSI
MEASKGKEEALAQQTSERDANLWWDTPPDQLNPQEQEEHDSLYAELLNGLYRTRTAAVVLRTEVYELLWQSGVLNALGICQLMCFSKKW